MFYFCIGRKQNPRAADNYFYKNWHVALPAKVKAAIKQVFE